MKLSGGLLLFTLLGFGACSTITESDEALITQQQAEQPGLFVNLPSELLMKILGHVYAAEKMVLKQTCLFFDDHLRSDFRNRFQDLIVKENQMPFWKLSLFKVFKEWVECENNGAGASRLLDILKKHHHYPLLARIASGQGIFQTNQVKGSISSLIWRIDITYDTTFCKWLQKQGAQVDVDLAKIIIAYSAHGAVDADVIRVAIDVQVPIELFTFMLGHLKGTVARNALYLRTIEEKCPKPYAIEAAVFMLSNAISQPEVLDFVLQNKQHIHVPFKTFLEELPENDEMVISDYSAREVFLYGNQAYHKLFLSKFTNPEVLRKAEVQLKDAQVLIDVVMESPDRFLKHPRHFEVAAEILTTEEQMICLLSKMQYNSPLSCTSKTVGIFFSGKFGEKATLILFHKFPATRLSDGIGSFRDLFASVQSGFLDWSYDTLAWIATHALGSSAFLNITQFRALPEDLPEDILVSFTRFTTFSTEVIVDLIRRQMSVPFLRLIVRSIAPPLIAQGSAPQIIEALKTAGYDQENIEYFSRMLIPFPNEHQNEGELPN